MRKLLSIILAVVLVTFVLAGCSPQPTTANAPASPAATASGAYEDGTYDYVSNNDGEGYFVKGALTISGGKISNAEWAIYDANRANKVFDKDYETVFAGNDTYIQQCRDNLKGMEGYSQALIDGQSIDAVDAVTGATWAYNKFSEFVAGALAQAAVNN